MDIVLERIGNVWITEIQNGVNAQKILTSHNLEKYNLEGLLFYRRRGTEEQRENKDKGLTLID